VTDPVVADLPEEDEAEVVEPGLDLSDDAEFEGALESVLLVIDSPAS